MSKRILLFPRGGLGNQLFQFGASFHLSHKLGLPIYVNNVLLGENARFNPGLGLRNYELNKFENSIIEENTENPIAAAILSRLLTAHRMVGDRFPNLLISLGIFANEKNDNLEIFQKISTGVQINSYCGTPGYFEDCGKTISEQITKILNPSNWYEDFSAKIQSEDPIALNVRLGDYKNLTHIYGKPDSRYYATGLDLIKSQLGDRPVWIFSDEPNLAKEILQKDIKIDYIVEHPKQPSPIEYLNLLAQCKGMVLANSSFSWWGGFISSNLNLGVQVVFPRPMFNVRNITEPFNWLPKSWITLGRDLDL